jgi:hypothetical protein
MAQSTLHFAVGMSAAACLAVPPLVRAWRAGSPVAVPLRRWILLSGGLGAYAVIPSLLRRLGLPPALWDSWWANLFCLYPLIERIRGGGILLGEAAVALLAGAQYLALLAAIRRAKNPLAPRTASVRS